MEGIGDEQQVSSLQAGVRQKVGGYGHIFSGTGNVYVTQITAPADSDDLRSLDALNDAVRRQWIEGYLEQSLQGVVRLELKREHRPECVENRWARVIALPGQTPRELPSEKKIIDVFEEHGRSLLILGEPGAGKTTTLLELCRSLQQQRAARGDFLVPIVLNLSTWGGRVLLSEWLVDELRLRYKVPNRIGKGWVEKGRLIVLLDGLDECPAEHRVGFVRALKSCDFPLPGVAVCCRLQEYVELNERVDLEAAVCLKPLSFEQVARYLERGGPRLAGLQKAIVTDEVLRELSTNPLMLSLMTLAFLDESVPWNGGSGVEEQRTNVFDIYTERMFLKRGSKEADYPRRKLQKWLCNLAILMRRKHLTVLQLEQLQPDSLPNNGLRCMYVVITRGLILLGLWLVLVPLRSALVCWLGPLTMLPTVVLACGRLISQNPCWHGRGVFIMSLGLTSLIPAVAGIVSDKMQLRLVDVPALVFIGIGAAVFLLFACPPPVLAEHLTDIRPVERIVWARAGWRRGAGWGAAIGSVLISSLGLMVDQLIAAVGTGFQGGIDRFTLSDLPFLVIPGSIGALLGAVIGAALGGLRLAVVPEKQSPNEGMKRCLIRCLSVILLFGFPTIVTCVFLEARWGIFGAILLWPTAVMVIAIALVFGGTALVRHYTLRIIIAASRFLPWNLVKFLEQLRRLVFLSRVGGGYVFVHRLLIEYFAMRGPTVLARTNAGISDCQTNAAGQKIDSDKLRPW